MFRQSPSRNHRARGFKVKHILQICVLIAVCLWLLYQVKHSHDKKKEFESNAKMSDKVEIENEIIKFGRKDLHPRVEESASETQRQNDEEETEEEEVKAEEEETKAEEEEIKPEETEEEGRGGGDDEIDEHDQERAEEEAEHAEDFFVEEKDKEEKDNEKEGQNDDTGSSEDHDLDGGDRTTQEAREEHYKGDDASSAVVRDAQEIDNGSSGGSNVEEQVENAENESDQVNKSQNIGKVSADQNDSDSKLVRDEKVEAISSGIATVTEEKATVDTLAKTEDVSTSNSTITTESNNQEEMNDNSKADNAKTPALSLQNGTETITDPTEHQNASEVSGRPTEGGNKFPTAVLEQTENPDATDKVEKSETSGEPTDISRISSSNVPELQAVESNVTAGTEDGSASSTTTAPGKKSDTTTETEENGDGSASSTTNENDNANVAQHDVTDSSDLSILQEVKENRVDLGTLPETETEGTNHNDAATAE